MMFSSLTSFQFYLSRSDLIPLAFLSFEKTPAKLQDLSISAFQKFILKQKEICYQVIDAVVLGFTAKYHVRKRFFSNTSAQHLLFLETPGKTGRNVDYLRYKSLCDILLETCPCRCLISCCSLIT